MKFSNTKSLFLKISAMLLFSALAFIIPSCRKDVSETLDLSNPEIIQAKTWYETTYPQTSGSITKSPVVTFSNGLHSSNADLSQLIKPDWQHNAAYTRFSKSVIEMPIDQPGKFTSSFTGGNLNYQTKYSRSSFLILKDAKGYTAYVMVVIADSSYVNNDLSKLSHNTYSKHDADFSGVVLYFTPKGRFLKSWGYKNGQIVPTNAQSTASTQSTKTTNNLHTEGLQAPITLNCTYYFWNIYVNGELESSTYLYKNCWSDGGGGGSGGGTSTAPDCVPDTGNGTNSTGGLNVYGDHAPVGGDPGPGDGGGFPPPPNVVSGTVGVNCLEIAPEQKLTTLVDSNDTFLIDCDSLTLLKLAAYNNYGDMYQHVAQFTPSQTVKDRIDALNNGIISEVFSSFSLQNLDDAFGAIVNSDFYPINITSLPSGMNMASLTEFYRLNLTNFTGGLAQFTPYVDPFVDDTQLFNKPGVQSVGALVHIKMKDNGTVVESDYQSNANGTYYRFTTMSSPLDINHPVSGNREFGIYPDPNNPGHYTFYTMGVDRTSDWMFATVNSLGTTVVFNGADELWTEMQKNLINYINQHGGQAGYYPTKKFVARPDYKTVKDYLDGTITLAQLKQKIGC